MEATFQEMSWRDIFGTAGLVEGGPCRFNQFFSATCFLIYDSSVSVGSYKHVDLLSFQRKIRFPQNVEWHLDFDWHEHFLCRIHFSRLLSFSGVFLPQPYYLYATSLKHFLWPVSILVALLISFILWESKGPRRKAKKGGGGARKSYYLWAAFEYGRIVTAFIILPPPSSILPTTRDSKVFYQIGNP